MDKISLVIPIYNVEEFVEKCLKSVCEQTYKNLEILCVDDCGNDNSMNIIKEFAKFDERIRIIHNPSNLGLAVSRNSGLVQATGEYVLFLDSDDYLNSDAIENMYNAIKKNNSDIAVISFKAFAQDSNDKFLAKKADISQWIYKDTYLYKVDFDNLENVLFSIYCMAWGKLYKTSFLKTNHLEFINKNVKYEDNGFYLKVLSCFPRVCCIPDVGLMYRIRANSITQLNDQKQYKQEKIRDMNAVLDDAFCYIHNTFNEEHEKRFRQIIKNAYMFPKYFKSNVFYQKIWGYKRRFIRVCGITLYSENLDKNLKRRKRLFGFIPV